MSQENVEMVRGLWEPFKGVDEAYKTGEFTPAIEAACHPDIVLRTSGMFPETGEYRGHEGVREFTANRAEAFEEISVQPEEFIDAGDRVVVPVRFGGKARHTGMTAEFSVVHVWTIHQGKATDLDIYRSRAEALEAAGLRE
jgi:uncharacterized protein